MIHHFLMVYIYHADNIIATDKKFIFYSEDPNLNKAQNMIYT